MSVYLTRFNSDTFAENVAFRKHHPKVGCIYGSTNEITSCAYGEVMFMIEMNNTTNKIEGIGLVRNKPNHSIAHRVYTHSIFNEFVYCGKYRLDRSEILEEDNDLVIFLDEVLFKGRGNSKRGSTLSKISPRIFARDTVNMSYVELVIRINKIFISKCQINILEENIQYVKR